MFRDPIRIRARFSRLCFPVCPAPSVPPDGHKCFPEQILTEDFRSRKQVRSTLFMTCMCLLSNSFDMFPQTFSPSVSWISYLTAGAKTVLATDEDFCSVIFCSGLFSLCLMSLCSLNSFIWPDSISVSLESLWLPVHIHSQPVSFLL